MRSELRAALIAAIAGALVPGCLLATSLDGFSGGPDDASPPVTNEGGADADAVPGDAPSSSDAADAAGPFRCPQQSAIFCADFESDPFDMGLVTTVESGGALRTTTGKFGRALEATIPMRATSTRPNAAIIKPLPMPAATPFTLSYDVLVDDPIGEGVIDYGGFFFNGPYYILALRSDTGGTVYLHEYADPFMFEINPLNRSRTLAHGPVVGKWTHVVMKVTFASDATSSSLKLTLDGDTVLDAAIDAYRYGGQPKLTIGIANAEDKGKAARMLYDDVLVTSP